GLPVRLGELAFEQREHPVSVSGCQPLALDQDFGQREAWVLRAKGKGREEVFGGDEAGPEREETKEQGARRLPNLLLEPSRELARVRAVAGLRVRAACSPTRSAVNLDGRQVIAQTRIWWQGPSSSADLATTPAGMQVSIGCHAKACPSRFGGSGI